MKFEEVSVDYFMSQKFPKEVVEKYQALVFAEEEFSNSKSLFSPKAPFERGDLVLFDQYAEGIWKEGKICHVRYAPYSSRRTFGAWDISILPLKKDFTGFSRITVNTIKVGSGCMIKKQLK